MKRLLCSLILISAAAALSGCYYDPGYSYVRGSGYGGDAYYGDGGGATYVTPAYGGYYGNGYYGGGGYYGCCYAPGVSVGISSGWYGGSRYRRDDYRGHRDYDNHAGHWQGRRQGDGRGNNGWGSHGGGNQGSHGSGQGSHGHAGTGRGGDRGRHKHGNDQH
ncbi:hypothetical protein ACVWWQ_000920 [Rhodanobacter sp. TND4EL1]